MVQFVNLPQTPQQRFSEELGSNIGQGIGKRLGFIESQKQAQQQQRSLAQSLFPDNPELAQRMAELPPDQQLQTAKLFQLQQASQQKNAQLQQAALQKQALLQQAAQQKQMQSEQKLQEKIAPLQQAFGTINRMREIGSKGNLGRGSAIFGALGGETAKDREEYEQLGKSLISFSTSIPIRNRLEFETLADKLYNPSLPDKARQGVLDAMERIINNSLSQYVGPQNLQKFQGSSGQKERPPLDSFFEK